MKCSKTILYRKTYGIPEIRFEDQRLTSFAGLILFQSLFASTGLKQKFSNCLRHMKVNSIYDHGFTVMLSIFHLLLSYLRVHDLRYYRDNPVVPSLLGITRLPDVATFSSNLVRMDAVSVDRLRRFNRHQVL